MMLAYSAEIQGCINEMQNKDESVIETAVYKLLAMNESQSQVALLAQLGKLKKQPSIYWIVINGLDKQDVLDAAAYYHKILREETTNDNHALQLAALQRIYALGHMRVMRIVSEAVVHQQNEQLLQTMLSMIAETNSENGLYRLVSIIRQHRNYMVRRLSAKRIVYNFDSDLVIPIALGMIYSESGDTDVRDMGVMLLWQCITQGDIGGYEQQIVLALQYCMYNIPDLGIMPYRCLMEIDTPEGKAALEQWDVDNKQKDIQFFR